MAKTKKQITKIIGVRDQNGVVQKGETLIAYPSDTTANGTSPENLNDGRYKFVFDYAEDGDGILALEYDFYIGGVIDLPAVPLGHGWIWYPVLTVEVDESPKTVNYEDLTDEWDNALPTTIPFPKITIMHSEEDLGFFITGITTTQFVITASTGGGATLPTDIHLKIQVGEQ